MAALSEPLGGIMSVAISGGGVHPSTWRGLGLFLRQSCIFILDVFPEAYF